MTDEPTTQAGRALETLGREYPWLRRRAVHIEEQAVQQLRDAAFDVLRLIETDSGWLPYSEAYLRLKDALGEPNDD